MNGPSLPSEWIARLFSRFQLMYGNKVTTMWGQVDPNELRQAWAEALGKFEGSDLSAALEALLPAHPDYPPTLPQFIALCSDARSMRTRNTTLPTWRDRTPMPAHVRAQLDAFLVKATQDSREYAKSLSHPDSLPSKGAEFPIAELMARAEAIGGKRVA